MGLLSAPLRGAPMLCEGRDLSDDTDDTIAETETLPLDAWHRRKGFHHISGSTSPDYRVTSPANKNTFKRASFQVDKPTSEPLTRTRTLPLNRASSQIPSRKRKSRYSLKTTTPTPTIVPSKRSKSFTLSRKRTETLLHNL